MSGFISGFISFIRSAEMLLGLVAFIGLILQRKSLSKVLTGTVKTIVGVLILFAGAGLMVQVLEKLTPMVYQVFGQEGLMPMTAVLLQKGMEIMGGTISGVFLGGFLVNIIIARFTRWKYIMLAGNQMLWISVVLPLVVAPAGLVGIPSIIVCSIIAGIIYIYVAAITQPYTKIITGGQPVAVGHMGGTGYALAGWLGKKLGDPSKSTESIKISDKLDFLKDNVLMTALVIFFIFTLFSLLAGGKVLHEKLGIEQPWLVFSLFQGLSFAAGLAVILYGVRMMLAEIVPAFHGVAEKLIPNAIPALDVPIIYPFMPNAVVIGFIASLLGGALATFVIRFSGGLFVVPPVMEHFFMGGAAGVFGNATGGRRGAVIGGIINGIFFTVLPVMLWQYTSVMVPEAVTAVDTDVCLWGSLVGAIARLIHSIF